MVNPKNLLKAAKQYKTANPVHIYKAAKHLQDGDDFEKACELHEKARRNALATKFKLKGMTDAGANEMARWVFEDKSDLGPRAGKLSQNDYLLWQNMINRSKNYAGKPLGQAAYILYMAAGTDEKLEVTLAVS